MIAVSLPLVVARPVLITATMRQLVVSGIFGVAVGLMYGLLRVRSPAPPFVALVGLLGMLAGEQAMALARSRWASAPAATSEPRPGDR